MEFALVALMLMAAVFTTVNFCYWVFVKTALRHAVREGTRFAITGQTGSQGHDAAVKQRVKENAFHLLDSPEAEAKIRLQYFASDGSGETASNGAGNIVVVSVEGLPALPIAPVFWNEFPITVTVRSVDKMEPFPGAPPVRTVPAS